MIRFPYKGGFFFLVSFFLISSHLSNFHISRVSIFGIIFPSSFIFALEYCLVESYSFVDEFLISILILLSFILNHPLLITICMLSWITPYFPPLVVVVSVLLAL